MVLLADASIRGKRRARASLLSWRSTRLTRVVSSTIAAETLLLSSALAEASWLQMILRDALWKDVLVPDWMDRLSPFTCAMASDSELSITSGSLSVVDAKSVFDVLSKNCPGGKADRKTSIELALIRDSLGSLGSQVRWIPHGKMPADCMTKIDPAKGNFAMLDLLRKGTMALVDEEGHLNERALNRDLKSRTRAASMKRLQEDLDVEQNVASSGQEPNDDRDGITLASQLEEDVVKDEVPCEDTGAAGQVTISTSTVG